MRPPGKPMQMADVVKKNVNFQRRCADLERRRAELLHRLNLYGAEAQAHRTYKNAQVLLNSTFRNASIAQRAAILSAVEWTINLIEIDAPMI